MPDGSVLRLNKLDADYDPHDRVAALHHVQTCQARGEVVTGLLYVNPDAADCHDILETVARPLNALQEAELCPGNAALAGINQSFR
jgi:2-oxoglutarate ferredoxin oxidoreductase subunit beta